MTGLVKWENLKLLIDQLKECDVVVISHVSSECHVMVIMQSLVGWLVDWQVGRLVSWLVGSIGSVGSVGNIGRLVDWLIDWLIALARRVIGPQEVYVGRYRGI